MLRRPGVLACVLLLVAAVGCVFVLHVTASTQPASVGTNGIISYSTISDAPLTVGGSVDVTLRVTGNTGFGTLPLRLHVPQGLQLTRAQVGHMLLWSGFTEPPGWEPGETIVPPVVGPAYVHMGWMTRTSNFTPANADLLTLSFEAAPGAQPGRTDAIRLSFATVRGAVVPTDIDGVELDIALADNGVIGTVVIADGAPAGTHGAVHFSTDAPAALAPGQTFRTSVRIEGNTGFATMPLRLSVPAGVALIGLELGHAGLHSGFVAPEEWDYVSGITPPLSGPAFVYLGWMTRTLNFFEPDATLLTLTFRVAEDAAFGPTENMLLTFATVHGIVMPTDNNGVPLDISPERNGVVGRINVGTPVPITVSVDPAGLTVENRANATVSFTVNVSGMPPDGRFPVLAGASASPGIFIEGLPENIAVSGIVTTNAQGTGSGTVTLTMTAPVGLNLADDQAELMRITEQLFAN